MANVDQQTEDVIRLSAAVQHARAQLEEARQAHKAAEAREKAAQSRLDAVLCALDEAVRAKAACLGGRPGGRHWADAAFDWRPIVSGPLADRCPMDAAAHEHEPKLARDCLNMAQNSLARATREQEIRLLVVPEGGTTAGAIRRLFRDHPTQSFTAPEVQRALDLPAEKEPLVRQNLRRLYEVGFLLREERGLYLLNPIQRAAAQED